MNEFPGFAELEFGGHHLGLNITMLGKHGVMIPTLTGARPALYTSKGKPVRVLAEEKDKAFALLNTLEENQRQQAILNYRETAGHTARCNLGVGGHCQRCVCETANGRDQGWPGRDLLCLECTDYA